MSLRTFERGLAFTLTLTLALGACGANDESASSAEENLSTDGAVTVVQCNPFFAGRYDHYPEEGATTYATAHRFAVDVAAKHPRTSIIGMEEMLTQTDVDRVVGFLHQATGHTWTGRLYQTHAHELGAAILWRTDVWTLAQNFGTITIDSFDHGGAQMSYGLPFGGALLQRGGREMAVYTGKLAWNGVHQHGHALTTSEIEALRVEEAKTLHAHILSTTSKHPHASRVILTDLNSEPGSPAWERMRMHYWDDDAKSPTRGSERLDYIFWDYDSGAKRKDGFFIGPITSGDFGSDHRYIAARVYANTSQ